MRKHISTILRGLAADLLLAYLGASWQFPGLIIHGSRTSLPTAKPQKL